jgi:hypothetical protein
VIPDAHEGLKNAARKTFQGSSWQRCRVHFARNVMARVPKAHQDVVAAALRTVFVHPNRDEISAAWDLSGRSTARASLYPPTQGEIPMARSPSKILTAAELRTQKKELKLEVSQAAGTIKLAERAIKEAQKTLAAQSKTAEAALAAAQKAHIAALKQANKDFAAVEKTQNKLILDASKTSSKAEARVAALAPADAGVAA